ncbi:MAG: arsenate reductase (glutaredoxin) [Bacteroidota bacterium]
MKIYHNPRCRKSRETLQLLEQNGVEADIVLYLQNPPSEAELADIVQKLGIRPEQLVRKGEAIYKEQFKGRVLSDEEWVDAMVRFPKLIERPIVIKGDKAVIGRPPENVLDLVKG